MKCPKCGYLGFERVERCRNCGYEFSLIQPPAPAELRIRSEREQDGHPLDDLALSDPSAVKADREARERTADFERVLAKVRSGVVPSPELPLFEPSLVDEALPVPRPSPPRPPLAVRRATPEVPRVRTPERRHRPLLDLEAPGSDTGVPLVRPAPPPSDEVSPPRAVHANVETARVPRRLAAAAIDMAILGFVDCIVVYFTLQICGLSPEEWWVLPKGPLVAFLLVQNGGYLVAFTIGGQTLGKMATGIRVVPTDPDIPLHLGNAIVRTFVWGALALPAGLGFLTALFGRDGRGLHDHCAGTRVVRAAF